MNKSEKISWLMCAFTGSLQTNGFNINEAIHYTLLNHINAVDSEEFDPSMIKEFIETAENYDIEKLKNILAKK